VGFFSSRGTFPLRDALGNAAGTGHRSASWSVSLAPELFLYQREVRGMSLEDLIDGWETLADAVVATATATPSAAS